MDKTTAFFTFDQFHGKRDSAGTRIRAEWLINYWPEAEIYKLGKKYQTIIFQKVYMPHFARLNKDAGIKQILDICDPDIFTRAVHEDNIFMESAQYMNAITTSTENLAKQVQKYFEIPVRCIPDRLDLELFKEKKVHQGEAKSVVWFGYSQNSQVLDLIKEKVLNRLGLRLIVISDKPHDQADEFIKWDLETFNTDLIKADFCLLPDPRVFMGEFKSNNKEITAQALGMPVAKSIDDLERFISEEERKKESELRLKEVKEKWDVKLSIQEMQDLIKEIKK